MSTLSITRSQNSELNYHGLYEWIICINFSNQLHSLENFDCFSIDFVDLVFLVSNEQSLMSTAAHCFFSLCRPLQGHFTFYGSISLLHGYLQRHLVKN